MSVVFVSTKGSIVLVIQAVARCSKLFKITEIEDDLVVNFLVDEELSKHVSEQFIQYAGGRFIYMVYCINFHRRLYPDLT